MYHDPGRSLLQANLQLQIFCVIPIFTTQASIMILGKLRLLVNPTGPHCCFASRTCKTATWKSWEARAQVKCAKNQSKHSLNKEFQRLEFDTFQLVNYFLRHHPQIWDRDRATATGRGTLSLAVIRASAKRGVHINAKYAIYRLLHTLHIKLHISAYFHYIFLHIWLLQCIYLPISCIFLAYYWQYLHIFSIYLHITCIFKHIYISGIFRAYVLHIWLIQSMRILFCIFKAHNCIFMAYNGI